LNFDEKELNESEDLSPRKDKSNFTAYSKKATLKILQSQI
jgi:hypothetical protein